MLSSYCEARIIYSDSLKSKVILVNPGSFYIRSIDQLVNDKILDTAMLQFHAVFYSGSEIKKSETDAYMKKNGLEYIKSIEIDCDLDFISIYRPNECSSQFREIFKNSDGIIFFGGWDIPPAYYGQQTALTTEINTPNRHLFELSFLFHLLGGYQNSGHREFLIDKPSYVVLGICLGMQSMNVATGGDMYQDIPSFIYKKEYAEEVIKLDSDKRHRNYYKNLYPENEINSHSFHRIKITDDELRANLKIKDDFFPLVVSSHHQAVRKKGKDILFAGTSMDGKVVEILKHKKYNNVLGTQFHPEFYTIYDPESDKFKINPEDPEPMTEYQMLNKHNSFDFHRNIWKYFNERINMKKKG